MLTTAATAVVFIPAQLYFIFDFKKMLKELIRIEVDIYIVACDRKY